MKLIHLTDPHLVAPGALVHGLDPRDRFSRVLDDIAEHHGDAEFCVISGDLAHEGDPRAYAWLAERLTIFPIRTILMTGNHDARGPMQAELPGLMDDGAGFVQGVMETAEGVFLFLDTHTDPAISSGDYCARRRAWLAARLEEARGRPVRIFMHHPPFDIGVARMDEIRLDEPDAFAALLDGHDVRHIFFGHVHRAVYAGWHGIPCTALPGTSIQIPQPASMRGVTAEPAMYGIVLIEGARMVVTMDAPLDRRAL